jgi:XisI protein
MDRALSYADILKKTLQEATLAQPRLQAIQLYPVCDTDSGHFLILATGWDKQRWIDTILFHARLVACQVIIEEDNFEEGLTSALIAAGIQAEHILTSFDAQSGVSSVVSQAVLGFAFAQPNLQLQLQLLVSCLDLCDRKYCLKFQSHRLVKFSTTLLSINQ